MQFFCGNKGVKTTNLEVHSYVRLQTEAAAGGVL